jgi:hypothetical protein
MNFKAIFAALTLLAIGAAAPANLPQPLARAVGIQTSQAAVGFGDVFQNGNVIRLRNETRGTIVNLNSPSEGRFFNSWDAVEDTDSEFIVSVKPGTNVIKLTRRYTNQLLKVKANVGHLVQVESGSDKGGFDSYQSWYVDFNPNGSGNFQLLSFQSPGQALNVPYGAHNKRLTTANRDWSDKDTLFTATVLVRANKGVVISPPPTPAKPVVNAGPCQNSITICEVGRSTVREGQRKVAILASVRAGNEWQGINGPGHTAFGVANAWWEVTYSKMSNGTLVRIGAVGKYDQLSVISASGPKDGIFNATYGDEDFGMKIIPLWFENQAPRVRRVSFRVLSIDENTFSRFVYHGPANKPTNQFPIGNCRWYTGVPVGFVKGSCNCTSVSFDIFKNATGESFPSLEPTTTAQAIDRANGQDLWWQ